jgi:Flp pilus assembly protein TadG
MAGDAGSTLVEFAMIAPLMLAVLTGAASFSMALYSLQQLQNATYSATTLLGDNAGITSDPCNLAMTTVTTALPNWTASKLTYTVNINGTIVSSTTSGNGGSTGFTCKSDASDMSVTTPEPVTLTVTYTYSWLPILNFSPSSNLTASSSALMQ